METLQQNKQDLFSHLPLLDTLAGEDPDQVSGSTVLWSTAAQAEENWLWDTNEAGERVTNPSPRTEDQVKLQRLIQRSTQKQHKDMASIIFGGDETSAGCGKKKCWF